MTDDAMWKRRFFTLMLARLSGTVLALLGLLVGFTDVFQPGGFRAVGILLVAAGLIDLAVLPMILRKQWRKP
ncbi:MAG: hypothetical protein LH466_02765 [Sphingomonas bacterium]|nr:hypothetical protein [Sphingomonas bacterium]